MTRPPVLIEQWLPIAEVGVESMRERGASSALPPLYFLHVWWARRPLIASRAAILAGVLPQWRADWPADLLKRFPTEIIYHQWFLNLLGVRGDPVKGYQDLQKARQEGKKIPNPYEAGRAFSINPSGDDLIIMGDLLEYTWGTRQISMLDPFSGGGSIPFEALRYGLTTYANDLNPVAATILKATLDYPARFGPELAEDIRKWGKRWYELVKPRLQPYFSPLPPNAEGAAYLWARTVQWQGRTVPLSPNWWLSTGDKPVAVRVIADPGSTEPRFEILEGRQIGKYDPDQGTVSRGMGRCPWTGETIDGDYIKAEAQAGRMGQVLYAIVLKVRGGFEFRAPSKEDAQYFSNAVKVLENNRPYLIKKNLLPTEAIPEGNKTSEPRRYGEYFWENSFGSRQLLTLVTYSEILQNLENDIKKEVDSIERTTAIMTYLAIALDKAVVYNNRHCRFDPSRGIRSVFDRHDFAFVWSHAEFDGAANLLPWVVDQTVDAYSEISKLTGSSQISMEKNLQRRLEHLNISRGSALGIKNIPNNSITNISVDPPYYDNVQYAELADFFYVWLKRSVGHLFPEFFIDELTNKDDEAVANPARFAALGSKKTELAAQDYERKMAGAFREMHRVLHPDGVLTVMFTHKKVEAWDTLASAIIGAGFTIQASWPVHTESEHSLHQAKKNAAASTIMLVCRKREQENGEPIWWDDLQARVRAEARSKAAGYAAQGISGADLYISTFGPTLSIISQHWPVLTSEVDAKTGQPKALRPEMALDLAREEVVRLRKQGLLAGREVKFDPVTDWYLMAWDAYAAEEFPYDEARKLAIALGVDLDRELMAGKRLAAKKGEFVVLQTPAQRRKTGMVDDELTAFSSWIDAAHTAMMIYAEDGAGACNLFMQKANLKGDKTFKALLQAMINAIPRSRIKGKFVRLEAEALENMRLAFFSEDLIAPKEEEPELPQEKQLVLWETADKDDEAE